MANPKISLLKSGLRNSWASKFDGTQTWTSTVDYDGGYGGWRVNQGYYPYVDTTNKLIKWQSTYYWYYSQGVFHLVEPSTSNITKGNIEGTIYARMDTGYHRQTTSFNFFCSNADHTQDDGAYRYIRNTNGLTFAVCSYGGYDGSYTEARVYLNGTLIASLGTIASCSTYYTIKFKLIGSTLYAYFGAGDLREIAVTLNLISNSVAQSALNGSNTIIWISGWATNDQGESMYGEVNSIALTSTC